MTPNFVKIGIYLDKRAGQGAQVPKDCVVARHVVERDFLEANPERYPGEWVECPTADSGLYDPQIGDFYDRATGLFTPKNGDWSLLDDVIPETPSE